MAEKEEKYNYIPFHEFILQEGFEQFGLETEDLFEVHKALVKILKLLKHEKMLEIELPEFSYTEEDFNGEFSNELKKIVELDGYALNFYDVFCQKSKFNIDLDYFNLVSDFVSAQGCPVGLLKKYENIGQNANLIDLYNAINYARHCWTIRATQNINIEFTSCAICQNDGTLSHLDSILFGNSLFVHYTGKVLEMKIVNNQPEYVDLGALYIYEEGSLLETLDEDKTKFKDWLLEQYEKSPDMPPSLPGKSQNKENFIFYALSEFTFPKVPEEKKLKIRRVDIERIWSMALPEDSKWKNPGTRKHLIANPPKNKKA